MVNECWTVSGGKAFFGTPQFKALPGHNVEPGFSFGGSMSRSRKKHPITGITTAETDKPFKQQEHSRERAAVRDALKAEKEVLPHPKGFGDPWNSDKDGKKYQSNDQEKAKRK